MNEADCCAALDLLDREVLVIDPAGAILFANRDARCLIDAPMGGEGDLGVFTTLWREDADEVRALVRRLAGTSTWQPFNLTRASGQHDGLKMRLRARAFLSGAGDARAVHLLVTADTHRERAFEDHRRLIRHLNVRLAEGSRTETLLTNLLENERRLRGELIHRVKNNLTLLLSLIRFGRTKDERPEVGDFADEIARRVLSIAAVHDILDRNDETDYVRADQLIERICSELETALVPGSVTIERSLVPVRLHIQDATPLALIINELVTNALKHAFPGGGPGHIAIELKKNGVEKLEAVVRDDGVGFAGGAANENDGQGQLGSGHGGVILKALAQQIRGEIVRTGERGTAWQLVFEPREAMTDAA